MQQSKIVEKEDLRYERKFLITGHSSAEVEQILKFHPACFSEAYHERRINNIYFDDYGFENYFANVDGQTDRQKIRIRWYGDLFGTHNKSVLEFKIKRGLLGKKESYPLAPFTVDENFSKEQLANALASPGLPEHIRGQLKSLYPSLLNSYVRKYFISADKKFRMTLDRDLVFYRISYNKNVFITPSRLGAIVVELKYDSHLEEMAKSIGSAFPFALTKNSKYLQGLEHVLF